MQRQAHVCAKGFGTPQRSCKSLSPMEESLGEGTQCSSLTVRVFMASVITGASFDIGYENSHLFAS